MNLSRRFFSEFLGTAFLLMIVVGSGIMGERQSQGNAAIALLANRSRTSRSAFAGWAAEFMCGAKAKAVAGALSSDHQVFTYEFYPFDSCHYIRACAIFDCIRLESND